MKNMRLLPITILKFLKYLNKFGFLEIYFAGMLLYSIIHNKWGMSFLPFFACMSYFSFSLRIFHSCFFLVFIIFPIWLCGGFYIAVLIWS